MHHHTSPMLTGHCDEALGAVQADDVVAEFSKEPEIATGTHSEIQDPLRCGALDRVQSGRTILLKVMVSRAFPEDGRWKARRRGRCCSWSSDSSKGVVKYFEDFHVGDKRVASEESRRCFWTRSWE